MTSLLEHFHFLRPWWLAGLLPTGCFCYLLWRHYHAHSGLEHHIPKQLVTLITLGKARTPNKWLFAGLTLVCGLTLLALAGPTWKKLPQAHYIAESALVIALDLSPSMMAEDIKPSRILRARLKIQELLKQRRDGLTALIVYAGEAFTVVPFTSDTRTLANLLPTLTPGLLPVPGSNVEMSIALAKTLLDNSRLKQGSLLLVTDGIAAAAIDSLKKNLDTSLQLLILGIGTDQGAAIPTGNTSSPEHSRYVKDDSGQTLIAKRNSDDMRALADEVSGYYLPLQADDSDIGFILDSIRDNFTEANKDANKHSGADQWYEFGPTLLLLILPLIALGFRRGYLLPCLLPCLVVSAALTATTLPVNTQAETLQSTEAAAPTRDHKQTTRWQQLWKNSDQRGLADWQQQHYGRAAETFKDPQWRGSAHYKQGDYAQALADFAQDNSAIGDYNRGNALAQLGRYQEAIAAYDSALKKQADLTQAKDNKQLLEQHLQNQEKEKEQKQAQQQQQEQQQHTTEAQANSTPQDRQAQQQTPEQPTSAPNPQSEASPQQADKGQNRQQTQQDTASNQHESSPAPTPDTAAQAQQNPQQNPQEQENNSPTQQAQEVQEVQAATAQALDHLSDEAQQALQQWLRKIPDDPSGLLRRKFDYEYRKRSQLYQQGQWQLPKNNAHKRY